MFVFQYAQVKGSDFQTARGEFSAKVAQIYALSAENPKSPAISEKIKVIVRQLTGMVANSKELQTWINGSPVLKSNWEKLKTDVGDIGTARGSWFGDAISEMTAAIERYDRVARKVKEDGGYVTYQKTGSYLRPEINAEKAYSAYAFANEKISLILDCIGNGNYLLARTAAIELTQSEEYRSFLGKSPEFKNLIGRITYGLDVLDPSSKSHAAFLAYLNFDRQDWRATGTKLDNVLTGLPEDARLMILANAYKDLSSLHLFSLDAMLLLEAKAELSKNAPDNEAVGTVLDGMAMVQDIRLGIRRQVGTTRTGVSEKNAALLAGPKLPTMESSTTYVKPMNMLEIPRLSYDKNERFIEGGNRDAINQAYLAGNLKHAGKLIDQQMEQDLLGVGMEQLNVQFAPKTYDQNGEVKMAMTSGFKAYFGAFLAGLFPGGATIDQGVEAYKSFKKDNSLEGWLHVAGATAFLAVDIFTLPISTSTKAVRTAFAGAKLSSRARAASELGDELARIAEAGRASASEISRIENLITEISMGADDLKALENIGRAPGSFRAEKLSTYDILLTQRAGRLGRQMEDVADQARKAIRDLDNNLNAVNDVVVITDKAPLVNVGDNAARSSEGLLGLKQSYVKSRNRLALYDVIEDGRTVKRRLLEDIKKEPLYKSGVEDYETFLNTLQPGTRKTIEKLPDNMTHTFKDVNGTQFTALKDGDDIYIYMAGDIPKASRMFNTGTDAGQGLWDRYTRLGDGVVRRFYAGYDKNGVPLRMFPHSTRRIGKIELQSIPIGTVPRGTLDAFYTTGKKLVSGKTFAKSAQVQAAGVTTGKVAKGAEAVAAPPSLASPLFGWTSYGLGSALTVGEYALATPVLAVTRGAQFLGRWSIRQVVTTDMRLIVTREMALGGYNATAQYGAPWLSEKISTMKNKKDKPVGNTSSEQSATELQAWQHEFNNVVNIMSGGTKQEKEDRLRAYMDRVGLTGKTDKEKKETLHKWAQALPEGLNKKKTTGTPKPEDAGRTGETIEPM